MSNYRQLIAINLNDIRRLRQRFDGSSLMKNILDTMNVRPSMIRFQSDDNDALKIIARSTCKRLHAVPLYVICGGDGYEGSIPEDPDEFAAQKVEFLKEASEDPDTRSEYVEVYNEPNCWMFWRPYHFDSIEKNVENYGKVLKPFYQAVKSKMPNIQVLHGGLATGSPIWGDEDPTSSCISYLREMSNQGLDEYFDITNIHLYVWSAWRGIEIIDEAIEIVPDKPLWITEFGIPTSRESDGHDTVGKSLPEDEQADAVTEIIEYCLRHDKVEKLFFTRLIDDEDGNDIFGRMGILRYDKSPKLICEALQRFKER